jgi:hypothetical protein
MKDTDTACPFYALCASNVMTMDCFTELVRMLWELMRSIIRPDFVTEGEWRLEKPAQIVAS